MILEQFWSPKVTEKRLKIGVGNRIWKRILALNVKIRFSWKCCKTIGFSNILRKKGAGEKVFWRFSEGRFLDNVAKTIGFSNIFMIFLCWKKSWNLLEKFTNILGSAGLLSPLEAQELERTWKRKPRARSAPQGGRRIVSPSGSRRPLVGRMDRKTNRERRKLCICGCILGTSFGSIWSLVGSVSDQSECSWEPEMGHFGNTFYVHCATECWSSFEADLDSILVAKLEHSASLFRKTFWKAFMSDFGSILGSMLIPCWGKTPIRRGKLEFQKQWFYPGKTSHQKARKEWNHTSIYF